MRSVSVTDLKARLSRYLRMVKRGGEVLVVERGVPVARLVGARGAEVEDEWVSRLVREGVLTPGSGDCSFILKEEPARGGGSLLEALRDDREDRA